MKPKQDKCKQDRARLHKDRQQKSKRKKSNQQSLDRRSLKSSKLSLWETESKWLKSIKTVLGPRLGYTQAMLDDLSHTHLPEALTHRTYAHEHHSKQGKIKDNQRLEFLGDAILGYISTTKIFGRLPNLNEGELSALRASLINRSALREIAFQAGLEPYLRLGRGEVKMGEAARDARLADLSEAIIAALYLDLGIESTTQWIWPFLDKLISPSQHSNSSQSRDPKTDLQHWSHQRHKLTPYYKTKTVEATQAGINIVEERYYQASVFIGESCVGDGEGRTKREAQRRAAQEAIDKLDFVDDFEL